MTTDTVLLTPPLDARERMGALHAAGAVMPGLGLLYIAANLRAHGFSVRLLDAEGLRLSHREAVERICQDSPKILGIAAVTTSLFAAMEVAVAIKMACPDIIVVLGGPHVTAMPRETMEECPAIDACIIGDGEVSFLTLVENVIAGREPGHDVDGVVWRSNGEIRLNPKTHHLSDLDSLPQPAWDLLDHFPGLYRPPLHSFRRLPVANIVTSRGCPGVCSFCDRSVFGRKAFFHSIDYIVEMVEYLVKDFGIRELAIKDDMFTVSKERVHEFCHRLRRSGLDVVWSCNARTNYVDGEMLREMRAAGCWMISYGIESGSPTMLHKMMKGATKDHVRRALRLTRASGIVSKGFFMLGIPGETEETLEETMAFLKELKLDEISINFFTPFPGSKLYQEILTEGFAPDFRRMSMQDVVYLPKGLSTQTLRRYQRRMILAFYLRPGKIVSYLCKGLRDDNERKRLWRMGKAFYAMIMDGLVARRG